MSLGQAIIATLGWFLALIGGLGWDGKIPQIDQPETTLTLVALGLGIMTLMIISAARRSLRADAASPVSIKGRT